MEKAINNAEHVLTGLVKELKELKDSHKRIAEYEAHIARERQLISAKIEILQGKFALRKVKREVILARGHSVS